MEAEKESGRKLTECREVAPAAALSFTIDHTHTVLSAREGKPAHWSGGTGMWGQPVPRELLSRPC